MKYYITKAGEEMVGPIGMLPPNYPGFDESDPDVINHYNNQELKWQAHLASLPRVKHRLPNKVGDIVEEGKDFEWEWMPLTVVKDLVPLHTTVQVAIPKGENQIPNQ